MRYFTALSRKKDNPDIMQFQPVGMVTFPDGVAFVHDIAQSSQLPDPYQACDAYWVEPPWKAGYESFLKAAGATSVSYADYLRCLANILHGVSRPAVAVCGANAMGYLQPDEIIPTTMNGDKCFMAVFGNPPILSGGSSEECLATMAAEYACIGDFCCGYGRTGCYAREAGKRFVMSDINPRCIGAISEFFSV